MTIATEAGAGDASPGSPDTPYISIIVPHYEDLASLGLCLDALMRQEGDLDFEIVVADNMSPSGEAAVSRVIDGRARLTIATQKGAGPARNAGVAASRGRILAFTDCDCIPDPGWLQAGVAALASHDFVGGRMTVLVPDPAKMSGAEGFERVFAFNNRAYVEEKGFTVTANLFCPRALFDTVGGFRTGVSEDLEWCHRARDAGYRIGYAADAVVGHPARADWGQLRHKWRRINAETFGLYAGKPLGRVKWALRSLALPATILAHVPRILSSPAVPGAQNKARALGTLVRIRLWRLANSLILVFGKEP
ncbi:glycosyltransferase family 2 protein [Novosphingobium mangrovi (ex Huang et al. 2023)]|uniref:Glycosyltransferase n=1 Tax=Novosphingobium mangrovi (ex Huang et al. 2023) TaxID=2976432 RepID=A0ABT2I0S3_9SPHN|nr:glycosyltransferase [Novosphingobium mangrovi (ex Huang et al. 2023)]MCT2398404.1 glycosyltransferase [Novosphingobium mangrovi (ex Huang et al. 2023)]